MSPCGVPQGWPALQNQRPDDPVKHLAKSLEARIATASWLRRYVGYPLHTWVIYRPLRATRRGFETVTRSLTAAPLKTLVDVVTGLPIALLVWPPVRDWAVHMPRASIAFVVFIVLRVGYTAYRRNDSRQANRQAVRHTQRLALAPIEMVQAHGLDAQQGHALGPNTLHVAVKALLDSMILLTRHGLEIPAGVSLHANLMLPMEVVAEDGTHVAGVGIVEYNTQSPAGASWTKVIAGDLVAGTVLQTGKVEVLEDTRDPVWWGVCDRVRSRSFATFPITAPDRSVIGVVNLDADKPMIFKRGDVVRQLWPVLAPPLRLFAQLLGASREA